MILAWASPFKKNSPSDFNFTIYPIPNYSLAVSTTLENSELNDRTAQCSRKN